MCMCVCVCVCVCTAIHAYINTDLVDKYIVLYCYVGVLMLLLLLLCTQAVWSMPGVQGKVRGILAELTKN
jgi:hypothetical protein